jgi:hypothetical protein
LLFIGKDFPGLTSFDKELLTSILLIGALIGALATGKIADKIARRPAVLGTAALFVAGVMLAAFNRTSSRPSAACRAAGPCSTPKWSGSFSAPDGTPTRWPRSPGGSAGAVPDRVGTLKHRHRAGAVHFARRGGEARGQHLRQAGAASFEQR